MRGNLARPVLRGPERSNAPRLPDETWFAELTNKQIRRGVHTSVQALEADIRARIATWNTDPRPYVWTKTANQILEYLAGYLKRIPDSRH